MRLSRMLTKGSVTVIVAAMVIGPALAEAGRGSVRASRTTTTRSAAGRTTTTRTRTATTTNRGNVNRSNYNNIENAEVYHGRRGTVVKGEEGAAAVGRRGAVVAGEEGVAARGRHGGVYVNEERPYYEDEDHWKTAVGIGIAAIAIGTVLRKPPAQHTTVVVQSTTYYYADHVFYAQSMDAGQVVYQVIAPPPQAVVPMLPPGSTTVVISGTNYHLHQNTHYVKVNNGYKVVVIH